MADMTASVTLRLVDKLTGGLGKSRREVSRFRRELNTLQKTGSPLGNEFRRQAAALTTGLRAQANALRTINASERERLGLMREMAGVAAGYAGYKAIKMGADLETTFTDAELKFNGSREAMEKYKQQIKLISKEIQTSFPKLAEGWDTLLGRGFDPDVAVNSLELIGKIAKATGSDMKDVASTQVSLFEALEVKPENLKAAQTALLAAGKEGAFEYEDMARYAPSMASMFKNTGARGLNATIWMGSIAQIIRKNSGTSAEVMPRFRDLWRNTLRKEEMKKFGEYGIDIRKDIDQAIKANINPAIVLIEAFKTIKKEKPDFLLNEIYTENESQMAAQALIDYEDELRAMEKAVAEAASDNTMIDDDYKRRMEDLNEKMAAFANASERVALAWAEKVMPNFKDTLDVVTPLVEGFADVIDRAPLTTQAVTTLVGGFAAYKGGKFIADFIGFSSAIRNTKIKFLEGWANSIDSIVAGTNKAKPSKIRALAGGLKGLALSLNPWMLAAGAGVGAFALIDWLNDLPEPHERAAKAADKHKEALENLGGTAKQTAKEFMAMTRAQRENRVIELQGLVADLKNQRQALGDKLGWQASKIDAGWGGAYSDEARAKAWAKHRNLTVTDANSEQLQKLYQLATTKAKSGDFASALREAILQNPEWQEGLEADRKLVQQYLAIQKQEQTAAGQVEHTRALLKAGDAEQAKDKLSVVQADTPPLPKPRNIEDEISRAFAGHFKTMGEAIASQKAVAGQGQSGANEGKTKAQVTTHIGPVTINNNGIGTEEAGRKISAQLNQLNQSATDAALYDNEMVSP